MIIINGKRYIVEEFHNGEAIFKKPYDVSQSHNVIELIFKNNKDITNLQFLKLWLDEQYPNASCELVMKYCPYERMDREINEQLFSMKYFAKIIAMLNFNKVSILDPHSLVCVEELRKNGVNLEILDLETYVEYVVEDFKPDYICYPDKGAHSKYPNVLKNINIPCFYGQKKRDLENKGKIVDYELVDAPDLKDKKVLIIDDICCLGGTAYSAAVQMKYAGAKEVAFYISHCEDGIFVGRILTVEPYLPPKKFKIGNKEFEHYQGDVKTYPWAGNYTINKVYTADTMDLSKSHDNITIVK